MSDIEEAIRIIKMVKKYHSIGSIDNCWTVAKLDEALKLLITPEIANIVSSDNGGMMKKSIVGVEVYLTGEING